MPSTFPSAYPEPDIVTDGYHVCDILVIGAPEWLRTDLLNERDSRINRYGITAAQANALIVLSAQTYCPEAASVASQVLG